MSETEASKATVSRLNTATPILRVQDLPASIATTSAAQR